MPIAGQKTPIKHLSLHHLLPSTEHYMTYEGSTTHPGCWETTVWIILNKPIYISRQEVRQYLRCCSISYPKQYWTATDQLQMYSLRRLMQGSEEQPKAPLGNNFRLQQGLHHRTVRTNIDFFRGKHPTVRPIRAARLIFSNLPRTVIMR